MQAPVLKGVVLAGSLIVHHLARQHASVALVEISAHGAAKPSSFHHVAFEQLRGSIFPLVCMAEGFLWPSCIHVPHTHSTAIASVLYGQGSEGKMRGFFPSLGLDHKQVPSGCPGVHL